MNIEKDENVVYVENYLRSIGASAPIPEKDIKELIAWKKKGLITIYKKAGRYNLFVGAVFRIMFALERLRIRASYTLCSYIVIVMTSALLISAGTASAYMAHRYSKNVSSEAVHRGTGAVIMKDQIGTVQHRR